MRLRNNPNALEELKDSEYLVESFPIVLNNNTTIEIGMGKGEMLTKLAFENPDKFYIGIEKFLTVAAKASKKAKELNLKNFKIICEDVKNMENSFIGKVNEIWLTFSDPWPKKRHLSRRLTYKTFLNIYKTFLNENGVVKLKTDNDIFFDWSLNHLKENNWLILNKTYDLHNSKFNLKNVMTGYEKKWSDQGKKINYLETIYKCK